MRGSSLLVRHEGERIESSVRRGATGTTTFARRALLRERNSEWKQRGQELARRTEGRGRSLKIFGLTNRN